MAGLFMFIHVLICAFLILIILMQQGRGGGLTENFSSMENIFGAKTNETLVKGTTILAALFLLTCLSLAVLSAKRSQSLMSSRKVDVPVEQAPVSARQPAVQPTAAVPTPAPTAAPSAASTTTGK